MLQDADIDPVISYNPGRLRQDLTATDIADGFTATDEYRPIAPLTWSEVEECLAQEKHLLELARASSEEEGIDAVLDVIYEEDAVDHAETMSVLHFLDPGVAGLATALTAAGCATFYACSGDQARRHHARYPTVGLAVSPERAQLLRPLAENTGCGIEEDRGFLYIYARSATATHALGEAIFLRRDEFSALPDPSWLDGLAAALEESGPSR